MTAPVEIRGLRTYAISKLPARDLSYLQGPKSGTRHRDRIRDQHAQMRSFAILQSVLALTAARSSDTYQSPTIE